MHVGEGMAIMVAGWREDFERAAKAMPMSSLTKTMPSPAIVPA
jgi:hypothetical protein